MKSKLSAINKLNQLDSPAAAIAFERCCAASRWVEQMLLQRPFEDADALYQAVEAIWQGLSQQDWIEAFDHQPKIGNVDCLRDKFSPSKSWNEAEQAGLKSASGKILRELAEDNKRYEEKFGYTFVINAVGKSATEIRNSLKQRLSNAPQEEIHLAAEEQRKIIRLRLENLLDELASKA